MEQSDATTETVEARRRRAAPERARIAPMPNEGVAHEQPVLIEAAINGGTTKARNPNVPMTPDEIRADALRCFDAGATIVHAHNHDITLVGRGGGRSVPRGVGAAAGRAARRAVVPDPVRGAGTAGQARARATHRRGGAGAHGRARPRVHQPRARPVPTAFPRAACTPTRTPTSARRSRCARSRAGVRSSRSTNRASCSACSPTTAPVGCRPGRW